MNRRVVIIALVAFALLAAALLIVLRPPPKPVESAAVAPTAVPARPPRAAPQPTTPAASPAPVEAPRPAPPVEVAAAPPPPAVEKPSLGTLHIESDVAGAQVFIDRQFVGAAPVAAENLSPGTHQLNVSVEGFDSIADEIEVQPGERDLVVKFREVRLDSAISVIHKHGMGACQGRLVATPQGLRYETSNKDDAFTAGLLDLEMFQVDYLAKNLRVKLPKGRQFNFTDPQGNADHLFVFHRDVEKARERLRRGDPAATN